MRFLQTLISFLVEGVCLVASLLSFRAIASGLLISAALAVFMLMLGQPADDISDSEIIEVVSQQGYDQGVDDMQIYLIQMDRGKEKMAFYLSRWKWIAVIIALVLASAFTFMFWQQTDAAQQVSKRGVASMKGHAVIALAQMERERASSAQRDRD